jgi:hypothetical protein
MTPLKNKKNCNVELLDGLPFGANLNSFFFCVKFLYEDGTGHPSCTEHSSWVYMTENGVLSEE